MEWQNLQRKYERTAYRIVQKHIKRILNNIPTANATINTYPLLINGNITEEDIYSMFKEIYQTIGFDYGNRTLKTLEKTRKDNILFNDELLKQILLFLSNEGGIKITSVRDTLIKDIIQNIANELEKQGTVIDLQNAIYNVIGNPAKFFKWQALRIARTETTSASGFSAYEAAKQSNLMLTKEWIAATDDRTRHDHRIENGQIVDFEDLFIMADGSKLQYPGDVTAKPTQVINCRCTLAFKGKRDAEGMLILKNT